MTRPFIVVGDTHTHGGKVTVGAPTSQTNEKAIARVGDPAQCEIHGSTTIATGDPNVRVQGRSAARDGDKLACGATLIASQSQTGSE